MYKIITGKKYLNIPVTEFGDKSTFSLYTNDECAYTFCAKLTCGVPDYWVAVDLARFNGLDLALTFFTNPSGFGATAPKAVRAMST